MQRRAATLGSEVISERRDEILAAAKRIFERGAPHRDARANVRVVTYGPGNGQPEKRRAAHDQVDAPRGHVQHCRERGEQ